ncbi:hypothetical protein E4U26_004979 [Claviceps purpurea]|nr:hypothetical protein E4U26_004979 [Claviceps purpurea]
MDMDIDIDHASLALIVESQLHDLRRMTKGKHAIDQSPDSEVAARIMEAEVEGLASFYADKSMSRSIAQALETDGDAIAAHAREEQQAADDRAFAMRHTGQAAIRQPRSTATASSSASQSKVADDVAKPKLVTLGVGKFDGPNTASIISTRAGPSSASESRNQVRQCVACTSDVALLDAVRCACSHYYCRGCMVELFSATINDESLFPPRCCRVPISLDLIRSFLSAKLLGTYLAKKLEYETIDKTYCHVSTCSTFVPPVFLRDGVATCIKCQSKTCTMCKDRMHTQGDCPADTLTAEVLRMADFAVAMPIFATSADVNGKRVAANNGTRTAS